MLHDFDGVTVEPIDSIADSIAFFLWVVHPVPNIFFSCMFSYHIMCMCACIDLPYYHH